MQDGATVSIGLNRKQSERVVLYGLLTQAKVDGDFSLFHRITFYLLWILDNLGKQQISILQNENMSVVE